MTFASCLLLASVAKIADALGLHARLPLHKDEPAAEANFAAHLQKHGLAPSPDPREFQERFMLFRMRSAEVDQHNRKPNRRWTAGLNHLSDRTDLELKQLLGYKGAKSNSASETSGSSELSMLSKRP